MPDYLLLLCTEEGDEATDAERWAELPLWREINESLREAGLLVANDALQPSSSATTVRVRDAEVEVTDGPYATTKEVLAGYYLVRCADLDEALSVAARLPIARYGSVEVRPINESARR